MRGLEENVLNEIVSYFPSNFKFKTLQFLAKDFSNFVWNSIFNSELVIDFNAVKASACRSLLLSRRGQEQTLFQSGGIWSNLRHLKLVGWRDNASLLELIVVSNLHTLESIHLVRPDADAVSLLVALLQTPSNVKSVTIAEAELESVHDLCFLTIPTLTELKLNELFLIKDQSILTISPPSRSSSFEGQIVERDANTVAHGLTNLELYLLPFSELLNFLKISFSSYTFPDLKRLQIRCLSGVSHADQLAAVLAAKAGDAGLSALEDFDVGILTKRLLFTLETVCSGSSLRKLSFASRLEIDVSSDLSDFAHRFPAIENLSVRIKSSEQVVELATVVSNSNWSRSLTAVKVTWSVVNSIDGRALVRLRASLARSDNVHATQRTFILDDRVSIPISSKEPFEVFFNELCRDRIVCECDECSCGEQDESHILELAQEEWYSLEIDQRTQFSLHS